MSDRYALPDRFVLAYEAEKKSEVAEARKKANREGLRQIQEFADQHDYRQRALIPDAAQTKYVSSFSNHKRSKNQETDARDLAAAEWEMQCKQGLQRSADRNAERVKAAVKKLDAEWEMVEGDEDWEKVTAEEADENKEHLSRSGGKMTILAGGLQ